MLANVPAVESPRVGVRDDLPVFFERLADRLTFPLAWENAHVKDFAKWKTNAKNVFKNRCWRLRQVGPFDRPMWARERRDLLFAKDDFDITEDSRVPAYLLVPHGDGPFPAVLLLHDHGAEFRIGKEKVVEPWAASTDRRELARAWVEEYYGGRFLGDELARRGYVCLAVDALNWSDRGGAGFTGQQALASNLMHMGMSLAGLIAHEDLRAAEFVASQPQVDKARIAAMGLSMGAYRTWQVAALSDHISAGVAVCWMATVKGLMQPGNNQTKGQSAYTMLHPGLLASSIIRTWRPSPVPNRCCFITACKTNCFRCPVSKRHTKRCGESGVSSRGTATKDQTVGRGP